MSLNVHLLDAQKRVIELAPAPHGGEYTLFGFEVYRFSVWGHDAMKAAGCNTLHGLRHGDIWADTEDDVDALRHEAAIVLANLDRLGEALGGVGAERLEFYMRNLLYVIDCRRPGLGDIVSIG